MKKTLFSRLIAFPVIFLLLLTSLINAPCVPAQAMEPDPPETSYQENDVVMYDLETKTETVSSMDEDDVVDYTETPSFEGSAESFPSITPFALLGSWTKVNPATNAPFRSIVSIDIDYADGTVASGTGFLIGPNTVLTAAHVIYKHKMGGWASSIVLPNSQQVI